MKTRIIIPVLLIGLLLFPLLPSSMAGGRRCGYGGGGYGGGYRYGGYGYSNSDVAIAGLIGLASGILISNASRPRYYNNYSHAAPAPVAVYRSAPIYVAPVARVYTGRVCRPVRRIISRRRPVYVGRVCR